MLKSNLKLQKNTCVHLDMGDLLIDLCESTSLSAVSTRFSHRLGRRWTWRHPNGARAQIDHLLIKCKWVNSTRNCRAYSTLNLGSDHRMVCAKLRASLRDADKPRRKEISIDWSKLLNKDVNARFNLEIKNKYHLLVDEIPESDDRLQAEYDALLNTIEATAKSKHRGNNKGLLASGKQPLLKSVYS